MFKKANILIRFHGVLPRGEVVRLLERDGDFLVRETTRNEERQTVLSVQWGSPRHFIVQRSPEGLFRFEGPAFGTVQELIVHQFRSDAPVTSRSGAVLSTPVLREKWELNNDDVQLISKIGRGNFGDVYRAKLKPGELLWPCWCCCCCCCFLFYLLLLLLLLLLVLLLLFLLLLFMVLLHFFSYFIKN